MIQEQWQQYLTGAPAEAAGGAGLAWLRDLAAVRFEGRSVRDFLQGYLTCDTRELEPGKLLPTALCNLKGRVVMNGWCAPAGDQDVLLVLHESLVDRLTAFLKPYLMFSRNTTLADLRDRAVLLASLDLADASGLVLDDRRRLRVVTEIGDAQAAWEHHPHITADRWLASLTTDGMALLSAPVSETFLPQMLDLDRSGAIDFEKGCYLGQEVVARAQHRGQVKRRLTRLIWEGSPPPEAGADVTDPDGKPQGVVLQSAADERGQSGWLLAVLREGAPDGLRQGDVRVRSAP